MCNNVKCILYKCTEFEARHKNYKYCVIENNN